MIGAIIGDIVGSRFEFNNYRWTDFELFHPDCSFTDDSICTCAVADWALHRGSFAPVLQSWCRSYPNPMGGYGARFAGWIINPVPYYSFGNGAAMRVSPVPYLFYPSTGLSDAVNLVTSVSHDHPEGLRGAQAIAWAIWLARRGNSKAEIKISMEEFGYTLDSWCSDIRRVNAFNET